MKVRRLIKPALVFALIAVAVFMLFTRMDGGKMIQTMNWFSGYSMPVDLETPRPPENAASISAGKKIFKEKCVPCHGPKGDGKGEKAGDLIVKPRDFTFAVFKFRSTPSGELPMDVDIFKTVSRGIHGTAMLPRLWLTTVQKWQVVYYIKTFSDFFDDDSEPVAIEVPELVGPEEGYVERGEKLYERAKCFECHGREGRGDGIKAGKLKDDWQRPIKATNFRKRILKRGLEVGDIYLTIATGLNGAPMPSYSGALSGEEILALAYYIRSIAQKPAALGQRGRMMGLMPLLNPDEEVGMNIVVPGHGK